MQIENWIPLVVGRHPGIQAMRVLDTQSDSEVVYFSVKVGNLLFANFHDPLRIQK